MMSSSALSVSRGDGRLWVTALALSLILNAGLLVGIGLLAIHSTIFQKSLAESAPADAIPQNTVTIYPQSAPEDEAVPAAPEKSRFARTSADQAAAPPATPDFTGERDTRATSDRAPVPDAPPLPSQAGIEPKNEWDLETTESDYQDGELSSQPPSSAAAAPYTPPTPPADPVMAESTTPEKTTPSPGSDQAQSSPQPRERLLEGPNPVDVPVPIESSVDDAPKETPPQSQRADQAVAKPADAPKPKPQPTPGDPGFRGFQRKAAIQGSISRTGRSALNVADTPLGRYQAIISRAVEQEWQRNCVRHRDFITPGFLTVRFFVESSGRVKTVQFVGDMETGEVQKGFTLNSIRDAEIPAMPQSLKREYDKEPLELIFNFYF